MGAVLVASNNVWSGPLVQVIMTIIGWLILIKGAFIVLFPDTTMSLSQKWSKNGLFVVSGVVALVIGLILLYAGM